jgi:hypothetical protein
MMTDARDLPRMDVDLDNNPGSMSPSVLPLGKRSRRRPTEEAALAAIAALAAKKRISQRELLLRGKLFQAPQQKPKMNGNGHMCHCAYCRRMRAQNEPKPDEPKPEAFENRKGAQYEILRDKLFDIT